MRSVVVVLPASTCAMIPMLRMSARGVVRAIAKFRLDSEGWIGETPVPGNFRGADSKEKRRKLRGRVGETLTSKYFYQIQSLESAVASYTHSCRSDWMPFEIMDFAK